MIIKITVAAFAERTWSEEDLEKDIAAAVHAALRKHTVVGEKRIKIRAEKRDCRSIETLCEEDDDARDRAEQHAVDVALGK